MGDELGAGSEHFRVMEWFVAFRRSTPIRWVRWLTIGQRFKHVSCFGFHHLSGCWLFYDWSLGGTQLLIVPNEDADSYLGVAQQDAMVVRFISPIYLDGRWLPGQCCVTQVAHLIGVRSCALRPDALFRDVLADGGRIIAGDEAESTKAGPGIAAPAEGRAAG